MIKRLTFLILLVVFSACNQGKEPTTEINPTGSTDSTELPGASDSIENLPEFSIYNLPSTWTTQDGETLELKELHGKALVMVMIYTSCEFSCPQLVEDIKAIEAKVDKKKLDDTKFILVSIDPEADTPQRLKEFAMENDMDRDHWLFLRGTPTTTQEFAAVLSVKYTRISPIDFSHSNIISLFDKEGVLVYQREGLGRDSQVHQVLNQQL